MILILFIITLLPLIESISRVKSFVLLLIISCILSFSLFKKKLKFDLVEYLFLSFLVSLLVGTIFSWSFSLSLTEFLRYNSYFLIFLVLRRINIHFKYLFIFIFIIFSLFSILVKPSSAQNIKIDYFKQAWEGYRLSPIIGTGLDTFRYVSIKFAPDQRYFVKYPPNYFLQIFTESGITGSILFSLFLTLSIVKIIKKRIFNLGIAGLFFINSFNNSWQNISLYLYFWIILAITLPICPNVKTRSKITKSIFISLFTFFLINTIIYSTGKILLYLTKNNYLNIKNISMAGILIPWEAKQQQDLAVVALSNNHLVNQYYFVRKYNDLALRLDPLNSGYYHFRGNFENEINEYLTARYYFIKAVLLNPPGTAEIYRELSKTYIKEAQKYFDEGNILKSKSILLTIKKLFPHMILINIEKDYHSKKAIGEVIAYASRKTDGYQFWPPNINQTYNMIKNMIDKEI